MPDMSQRGAFLRDLIETLDEKKRQCWKASNEAKMRGEVYEECASELRYALEKEQQLEQQSNGNG